MKKDIKNAGTVACKLRPTLTKATNQKLGVAKEVRQKEEKIVKS